MSEGKNKAAAKTAQLPSSNMIRGFEGVTAINSM
jgi:hypothetical protein